MAERATVPIDEEVYGALRVLARRFLRRHASETLNPTGLVHEVWVRFARNGGRFADREHFSAVAALAMRQVLVDRSRRRGAARRGGGWDRVTLAGLVDDAPSVDLLALDRALDQLESLDPRQAQIAQLRLFAGATVGEIAHALELSESSVEKDWRRARAWLGATLSG